MPEPALTTSSPVGTARPRAAVAAVGVLAFCCVLWGYSFPAMQFATTAFARHLAESSGPTSPWHASAARAGFNAVRFALAASVYAALTWRRQRRFTRADWLGGGTVGLCFAGGMLLQVTGLQWTLPSVSAFLTALAVVFAPLAQWLGLRRPVSGSLWCTVALAVAGMVLLSWPHPAAGAAHTLAVAPPLPFLGEALTVTGAALFTIQILAVDRLGPRADAARLTLVMLVTAAVISAGAALAVGGPRMWTGADWAGLARDRTLAWSLSSLVLLSSVVALHLMIVYQPRVSPTVASVVYCSEPLFGTLFSLVMATERLTPLTAAGGAVTLASVLWVARQSGRQPAP